MSNYFRNNINQNNPEKKKTYTYYPKFNQKNMNFERNQHKIKENNAKYIYLDDPYEKNNRSNDLNHPNKINNCNVYNNNSIKCNYNNNIIFKKRNRNQFENINIKNYYFFNSSREDNTYDEYIIDYKAGLNNNFFRKKINLNKAYNNLSLQNWRNKNSANDSNRVYNKSTINEKSDIINKEINKNNTYDDFYHLNNSKGKKKKMNMEAPYKRRIIINDNNFICNNNEHNDNASINNINRAKHSLINKKILKRNNTSDNFKENKKFENRTHLNKNLYNKNPFNKENNYMHKKASFVLSKSSRTNKNISLMKIMNFIQHLSKYCSSYYSKIIKQLFEFLKTNNTKNKIKNKSKNNFTKINNKNIKKINTNINFIRKSKSPIEHIKKKNNYGINKKRTDKLNETLISNKSSDVLIDRIKTRNESLSPNTRDFCEMFRNINELNKKYETISIRKNKINNHTLKRDTNEISFNSENKSFNERYSSIERNKEKWESTINTERERKRRILEKKSKSKNKNNNIKTKTINVDKKEKIEDKDENSISKLIEKSRILKNKIKKLEEKNKKTIEVNWNLDAITINTKKVKKNEKEKEREKDFSFGDENKEFFSSNSNFGNSGTFNIRELIGSDKFDKNVKKNKNNMINVKKIITKDKRIFINMNYLNFLQNPGNKNKNITNCEMYKISYEFNIDLFGNKNKSNQNLNKTEKENNKNNNEEKVKYINKLTQITEEENRADLSENISQSSTENVAK